MGNLIEFPRKLEWQPVEAWFGRVANTQLMAKVERNLAGNAYSWFAWNGTALIDMGTADSQEGAKEAARTAMEKGTLVVRIAP